MENQQEIIESTRGFLRVHLATGVVDRTPLPDFLYGLMPESLVNLEWADPALGVGEYAWLPPVAQPAPPFDTATHTTTDETETLVADLAAGVVLVTPGVRPLTPEEIATLAAERERQEAELIKQYDGIVQGRLDGHARTFGYGDPNRPEISPILHVISYADEPAVVKFQAEGRLFRAWRSLTWVASAGILNAVKAGGRGVPTEAELLAELEQLAPAPVEADVEAEIARLTA